MTPKSPFLLAALLALGPAGTAIDIPLRMVEHPPDARTWLPSGSSVLQLLEAPPEAKLPELRHPKPLFAELQLGEGRFLVVLDSDGPDRPFYNRLLVDTNRNRDLTDDPAIIAVPFVAEGRPPSVLFPPIDLAIPVAGGTSPYRFSIRAYTRLVRPATLVGRGSAPPPAAEPKEMVLVYAQPACHMEGSVALDGQSYRIALADMNGNGLFGDQPAAPAGAARAVVRGDMLYLAEGANFTPLDAIAPGSQILLGGALFALHVEQGGKNLRLEAVEGERTALRFPLELEKLQLLREGSSGPITVFQPGREIQLPKGRYRLVSYQARRQDDGGNWWALRASAPRESDAWIEADGKDPVSLPMGEPFTASVTVTPRFGRSAESSAHLAFSLVGSGGERVSALSISGTAASKYPRSPKSSSRPMEPSFEVNTADGEQAASGSFEYG